MQFFLCADSDIVFLHSYQQNMHILKFSLTFSFIFSWFHCITSFWFKQDPPPNLSTTSHAWNMNHTIVLLRVGINYVHVSFHSVLILKAEMLTRWPLFSVISAASNNFKWKEKRNSFHRVTNSFSRRKLSPLSLP